MHIRRPSLVGLVLIALWTGTIAGHATPGTPEPQITSAPQDPTRIGYLLTFELQAGVVRLTSASDITNYAAQAPPASDDDWTLVISNAAGQTIGTRRMGNPARIFPQVSPTQVFPFSLTIPKLDGMASLAVIDHQQRERLRAPIDDAFRTQATSNRARFLASDRENQRLLALQAAGRGVAAGQDLSGVVPSFDSLPTDVQLDVARGIEQAGQFDPEVVARARALGTAPDAAAREMQLARLPVDAPPPQAREAITNVGAYTMSGTVSDAETGARVASAGLWVYQYTSAYQFARSTYVTADAAGAYSVWP